MNLNKAQLIGRVTKDPEVKKLPSGVTVCSFSLATNRVWKDKEGQKQESSDFHNIVAFGKTAEVIGEYVVKGQLLYTEGRLQTRSWEDKEGGKKLYRTEIILESFQFGPKAGQATGERPAYKSPADKKFDDYGKAPEERSEKSDYADSEEINPDDIPF